MTAIANLPGKGWKDFAKSETKMVRDIRQEIQNLATETGISISEFRRIVHMVQKGERARPASPRRRWWKPTSAS